MSVYLITGVSGYLGGRILEALTRAPHVDKIIGVDIKEPRFNPPILEFHKMDIRDEKLRDLARREKVEVFIHLAFVLDPLFNLVKMHSIDVWGTDNALRAAAAAGVKQIFVTSSASAYGALPDNPEPLTEDCPLRAPKHFQYAYDKMLIDHICQQFMADHPEVNFSLVRPCIVLGPNVDNYISRTIMRMGAVLVEGQDPLIQFVHEDDVANATMACIEQKANGIYNFVGDGTFKVSEMWEMKGSRFRAISLPAWLAYPVTDFAWQMGIGLAEAPSGQLDFFRWPWWASGEKLKKELGFLPKYSSKETFKIFLESQA